MEGIINSRVWSEVATWRATEFQGVAVLQVLVEGVVKGMIAYDPESSPEAIKGKVMSLAIAIDGIGGEIQVVS